MVICDTPQIEELAMHDDFDTPDDDEVIEFKETDPEVRSSVIALGKDIVDAATDLSVDEVRFLVDSYYVVQANRIRSVAQVRALSRIKEPHKVVGWLGEQSKILEYQLQKALTKFAEHHVLGKWPMSVVGIGPVITAGLISHINMDKAPTAGHIMSFAGLNPTKVWNKGEKRPWNADLKTLLWKAGESFVKFQNKDNCVYGHLFVQRKAEEWRRNFDGEYADQAKEILEVKKIGSSTNAFRFYSGQFGVHQINQYVDKKISIPQEIKPHETAPDKIAMLPPAHIHARARRWVVKIFISNLHEVWFEELYDKVAPVPYPFAHLGHVHKIDPVRV